MLQNITRLLAIGLTPICATTIINISDVKPARSVMNPELLTAAVETEALENPLMPASLTELVALEKAEELSEKYVTVEIPVVEETADEEDSDNAYAVIKAGSGAINVREGAGTSYSIVGHISDGCVGIVTEKVEAGDGIWLHIVSGELEGYAKADFFIYDEDVPDVIEDYIHPVAVVQANALFVRSRASRESETIGSVREGDALELADEILAEAMAEVAEEGFAVDGMTEPDGAWTAIVYYDNVVGYVDTNYISIEDSYKTGTTLEEERIMEAARAAEAAGVGVSVVESEIPDAATIAEYSSLDEMRQELVNYALKFEGIKYVMGGNSLVTGTDCSGFTSLIYAAFGYSIGRVTQTQWAVNGRQVGLDELLPGDIICYGTSTDNCYHVAIYIGDGKIVHEANSRRGCIVSGIEFEPILGAKRIIE